MNHINCPCISENSPECQNYSHIGPNSANWPVQMQLLSPQDPNLYQRDLLLAADCTLFSIKDFHGTVLQGKRLAIACPKLDDAETLYLEKLVAMIDFSEIASLSVVAMELPCCNDLAGLVQKAMAMAERKISGDIFIVKMNGEINKSKILA